MLNNIRAAASRRDVLALAAAGGGLTFATSPAEVAAAVSRAAPPPVPSDPSGLRAWYDRYINAFNQSDFETFSAYYADDILFEGGRGSVRGLPAVLADFRFLKQRVQQSSNVIGFVGSKDRISVEFHVITIGLQDDPDPASVLPKKGERRESINFAIYDLKDSRFVRARSALFRRLPANTAG